MRQQRVLSVYEEEAFEGIVLWDAAVLIESGGAERMDKLVVVLTDPATEHARLMARDGMGEEEARGRIATQMPVADKAKLADYVIDNSGTRAETECQVHQVYKQLLADLKTARAAGDEPAAKRARGRDPPPGRARRDARPRSALSPRHGRGVPDRRARGADVARRGRGDRARAGALTGLLASAAGRLVALEVDMALAARLRERFAGSPHVDIADADARSFDYASLAALKPDPVGRVLAVGNLPYSVGKPILMALVEAGGAIDEMALMLQREVAERVAAAPGSRVYGSMSVLTQVACDVRLAFGVPPGAFSPPPQVESAVIHLRGAPRRPCRSPSPSASARSCARLSRSGGRTSPMPSHRASAAAPSARASASPRPASIPAAAPRRSRSRSSRASPRRSPGEGRRAMGDNSTIEWTDATWNPVTGCTKISPGCKHCYAERLAERLQAMGNPRYRNGLRGDAPSGPARLSRSAGASRGASSSTA